MQVIELDNPVTAAAVFKVLQGGTNVTIELDGCKVVINSSGGGGTSNGTKYHLKSSDNITVQDCFEYFIACDFILDSGAQFTIEDGGRFVGHEGIIRNDGIITNDGIIKNGL